MLLSAASLGNPCELPPDVLREIARGCDQATRVSLRMTCKRLHDVIPQLKTKKRKPLARIAARLGHVDLTQWLVEKGFAFDIKTGCFAARAGSIEVFRLLKNHGYRLTEAVVEYALKGGNLTFVKYLYEGKICRLVEDGCCGDAAIESGNLDLVKYLHEINPGALLTYYSASYYGHLHILEWLLETGCGCDWVSDALDPHRSQMCDYKTCSSNAGHRGHLHVIEWLHKKEKLDAELAYFGAHVSNHPEVITWLHDHNYEDATNND